MMKRLLILIFVFLPIILFAQEVTIANGKLSFDACVWGRYYYLSSSSTYYYDSLFVIINQVKENSFARVYGFLGITGIITDYAKVRFYYDMGEISGSPAYDLYMSFTHKVYELRIGQLKPPTGMENLTPTPKLDFIEYSFISSHRTSTGITRDIGLQFSAKPRFIDFGLAIINGNGRNQKKDDNKWKDILGRLVFTPDPALGLTFGGSFYWGKTGPDGMLLDAQRFGAELGFVRNPVMLKGEFLYAKDDTLTSNGFYVSAGYRYCNLQPVIRFERYTSGKSKMAITGGINWFIKGDNVKPMLNYTFIDDKIANSKCHKIVGQLQFSF